MKITKFETREAWLAARPGIITGSKNRALVPKYGDKRLIGFYQLAADNLAIDDGSIDGRERGQEEEAAALETLENVLNIELIKDIVLWQDDKNPGIGYSPDGYTKDLKIFVEAKNLGSASHLQIIDTDEVPNDAKRPYLDQIIQGFLVNKKAEKCYFISADRRIQSRPYHIIEVTRAEVADQIKFYKDYEIKILKEVDAFVEKLSW